MKFDCVAQVYKVIGCAKLWESDVFHHPVDLDPGFLAFGPFLLDFSMRFLRQFKPIIARFPYVVDVSFP